MNGKPITSRQFFRQLGRAVMMFVRSPVSGKAKLLAASLLILMLFINGMNVLNSYVGRFFMSSIEKKDPDGFVLYAWMYVAVFPGSTFVAVLFRFAEERLESLQLGRFLLAILGHVQWGRWGGRIVQRIKFEPGRDRALHVRAEALHQKIFHRLIGREPGIHVGNEHGGIEGAPLVGGAGDGNRTLVCVM